MTPRGTRTVSFEGEKDRLTSFLPLPEGEGPSPGVMVIHEAFGLNENVRDVPQPRRLHGPRDLGHSRRFATRAPR